jgi:hypothetical protein
MCLKRSPTTASRLTRMNNKDNDHGNAVRHVSRTYAVAHRNLGRLLGTHGTVLNLDLTLSPGSGALGVGCHWDCWTIDALLVIASQLRFCDIPYCPTLFAPLWNYPYWNNWSYYPGCPTPDRTPTCLPRARSAAHSLFSTPVLRPARRATKDGFRPEQAPAGAQRAGTAGAHQDCAREQHMRRLWREEPRLVACALTKLHTHAYCAT